MFSVQNVVFANNFAILDASSSFWHEHWDAWRCKNKLCGVNRKSRTRKFHKVDKRLWVTDSSLLNREPILNPCNQIFWILAILGQSRILIVWGLQSLTWIAGLAIERNRVMTHVTEIQCGQSSRNDCNPGEIKVRAGQTQQPGLYSQMSSKWATAGERIMSLVI